MSRKPDARKLLKRLARAVIALDTEMERRAANPSDPGEPERWAARWQEVVDECRTILREINNG